MHAGWYVHTHTHTPCSNSPRGISNGFLAMSLVSSTTHHRDPISRGIFTSPRSVFLALNSYVFILTAHVKRRVITAIMVKHWEKFKRGPHICLVVVRTNCVFCMSDECIHAASTTTSTNGFTAVGRHGSAGGQKKCTLGGQSECVECLQD